MHLGILNGGGDAPALNAVIRAAVRTAIYKYDFRVTGFRDGFKGMMEKDFYPLGLDQVSGLLPKGGTVLGTTNRDNPFDYRGRDASREVAETFHSLGLDVLLTVGGDGTLGIAIDLAEKWQLPIIGIPKTIDNDLSSTDYTFGFYSAVQMATNACDILHDTAESHHRAMILEVMGRNAGWIALHAGMAGGADIILIPEVPFTLEGICRKIKERMERGKKFSIIVLAEGAKIPGEESATLPREGRANFLARLIQEKACIEARATVLGHLQRGGSPTAFDRILGTRFGSYGVDLAARKEFGRLVVLQGDRISSVPLTQDIKKQKLINPDHQLLQTARAIGLSFGE
ncbi:MAG TPA: 6-phosphofructokinase [Clostridia bacterium]|nr:6-phosphofructokinase [Clostridia bacterium]